MLEKFDFNGNNVRVIMKDDEPWFVAKDVCDVLEINNSRMAVTRLDEADVSSADVWSAENNRHYTVSTVNESGLYDLILDSRKPEAKAFRKWVTAEVLPTIRKTKGAYIAPGSQAELDLSNPDTVLDKLIEVAQIAKQERAKRIEAESKVAELEPKGEAFDQLMDADGCYSMATAAQMIGLGQNTLFRKLREDKILIDSGVRHNTPYQAYMDLFEVITRPSGGPSNKVTLTTRVKPAGIEWLRKRYSTQLV